MNELPMIAIAVTAAATAGLTLGHALGRRGAATRIAELQMACARLETVVDKEREAAEEKAAMLLEGREDLARAFEALSARALERNNESFLGLAKLTMEGIQKSTAGELEKRQQAIESLVRPVAQSLEKVDLQLRKVEREREGAYRALNQQVGSLLDTERQLRAETGNLAKALRSPIVRGRWGEMQLKRVVELAGMVDRCDFVEQETAHTEGGRLRPDLIVRLAGDKNIVVDAKAPLAAYLEAVEAPTDDEKLEHMKHHARQVRAHMVALSRKAYWDQFQPTPEMVVLFLPGEHFFSAALEHDPALLEDGARHRVMFATPTTLITLMHAVAYGWREEALAANAQQISVLGRELYDRVGKLASHWSKVGKHLQNAVTSYNASVGTLESRVLVTARRFEDLGAAPNDAKLEVPSVVELAPRTLEQPELTAVVGE